MTANDLKYEIGKQGIDHYFFTRETMRFFGDTMRNYGVRKAIIPTRDGMRLTWELFRRRPVKHGLRTSAYFDVRTFERVFEDSNGNRCGTVEVEP